MSSERGIFCALLAGALGVPLLPACDQNTTFAISAPDWSQSAIAVVSTGEETEVEAVAIDDTAVRLTSGIVSDGSLIHVLFFEPRLEELMIPAGRLSVQLESPRQLPKPKSVVGGTYSAEGSSLKLMDEVPASISDLRVPEMNPLSCARSGGCYETTDDYVLCRNPCRPGAAPQPPEPINRIEAPDSWTWRPCPDGWTEAGRDEQARCLPPEVPSSTPCPIGEARFDQGCELIGPACTGDEFGEGLPSSGVAFVSAMATSLGDGTREHPFGTLDEALAAKAPVVALGKGAHRMGSRVTRPVTILGACLAETSIVANQSNVEVVLIDSPNVVLKNLRISGGRRLVTVTDTGAVHLENVQLDSATEFGWLLDGGVGTADRLVIKNLAKRGLEVRSGARIEAEKLAVESIVGVGIEVRDGSSARFSRLRISDSSSTIESPREGHGLTATNGSALEVTDGVFEATTGLALSVYGSTATVSRTHITRTRPWPDGAEGTAIRVVTGDLVLKDASIRDTPHFALDLRTARARLESVAIEHAKFGVVETNRSSLRADKLQITRSSEHAMTIKSSQLIADGLVIDSADLGLSFESGSYGILTRTRLTGIDIGVEITGGSEGSVSDAFIQCTRRCFSGSSSKLELERVQVEGRGLQFQGSGAEIHARDLRVQACDEIGLQLEDSARFDGKRLDFEDVASVAIRFSEGAGQGTIEDLHVSRPRAGSPDDARALRIDSGSFSLTRGLFEGAEIDVLSDVEADEPMSFRSLEFKNGRFRVGDESWVYVDGIHVDGAQGPGILLDDAARLTARNVAIQDVVTSTQAEGIGVRVTGSAALDLSEFRIESADRAGLELDGSKLYSIIAPSLHARQGRVLRCRAGVQVVAMPTFELSEALDRVSYEVVSSVFETFR